MSYHELRKRHLSTHPKCTHPSQLSTATQYASYTAALEFASNKVHSQLSGLKPRRKTLQSSYVSNENPTISLAIILATLGFDSKI